MGMEAAFQLAGQFGPMGLLVGYLVWRDKCDDKRRTDEAAARDKIYEADIASREKLAASLSALSAFIQGRSHV